MCDSCPRRCRPGAARRFTEQAAHGAATGGVLAITRHLAASGAQRGIRANSISPVPAGRRVNALLNQLSDHFERYGRVYIRRSPKPWPTVGHREILDACKSGDR
jgi:NAD(P)-dependent dehydrogenase (short-subunit alcohol dehydrogenase family)